jgi:hypothetical protein
VSIQIFRSLFSNRVPFDVQFKFSNILFDLQTLSLFESLNVVCTGYHQVGKVLCQASDILIIPNDSIITTCKLYAVFIMVIIR